MDIRLFGLDTPPFLSTLHNILDQDHETKPTTKSYIQDAKAIASTPADVSENSSSYTFTIDMPGVKSNDIKVQVEDDNVLVISGERKREEEKESGVKYVRMERRVGKFMRKFVLPENADVGKVNAVCKDGVLCVTVEKKPKPEAKKPRLIEVKNN